MKNTQMNKFQTKIRHVYVYMLKVFCKLNKDHLIFKTTVKIFKVEIFGTATNIHQVRTASRFNQTVTSQDRQNKTIEEKCYFPIPILLLCL